MKRMQDLSSEQRFQLFAQHSTDYAMILTDLDGRILEWSSGAEQLLGWATEEAIGQSIDMIFPEADRAAGAPIAEIRKAAQEGRAADIRWHVRKDGSRFFADGVVNAIYGPDGELIGFGKILKEAYAAFKYRLAEQTAELADEKAFLNAVLESTEDGIVACNADGELTLFNGAAKAFHGLLDLTVPREQWAEHYNLYRADGVTRLPLEEIPLLRALAGEQVRGTQMTIISKGGRRHLVACSGGPLSDADGHLLGAVISMHDITARVEAQAAKEEALRDQVRREEAEALAERIRENEERVRLATEAAELGIWVWDIVANKSSWENERLYDIFGIPQTTEPVNIVQVISELVHPDDAEPYRQAIQSSLQSGKRFYFTGRFYRADNGALRWLEFTGLVYRAPNGLPSKMIGTTADITARKQVEAALRDAQTQIERILSSAEIATWTYDLRTHQVSADNNLAQLFGIPSPEGKNSAIDTYLEVLHPDDRDYVMRQIHYAVESGTPYQASYRVRGTEDEYRSLIARGRVEYDESGAPERLAGVVIDVTRQKQAEEALQASQQRYRTLFESIDEGFCLIQILLGADGKPIDYRFIEANPAFEKHTGLVNGVGRTARELLRTPDPFWLETYGRVAMTGEAVRFVNFSRSTGRWFDVYAARFGEPANLQVAILFNDITNRKKSEDELRRLASDLSDANRRKTEFLATLAHELRNPLAPISTGLEVMRLNGDDPGTVARIREIMERQTSHMARLIDDLLDIARINSGKVVLKKERIALNDIVSNAIETSLPDIQEAHHELIVHMPSEPLMLDADATRLAQVLSNLLNNAAKYTPASGRITVSVTRQADEAVIAVSDTGIGIPPESLSSVFEMFSQVVRNLNQARGGLGIGLSLVHSLVELHGGVVTAESGGPGQGSTFIVRLPLADSDQVNLPSADEFFSPTASTRRLRILIADDNKDAADTLASLLQLNGHITHVAHDGREALQIAETAVPDIAFLDIGMPGLSGYEVAQKLRQSDAGKKMLLIAVTGWGTEEDRARSEAAGFDHHLTKPVHSTMLNRLLADLPFDGR